MELETEVTGALGPVMGAHQPATLSNLTEGSLTDKQFSYSVASGVMVDVSLQGLRYAVDSKRNEALYSHLTTPAAILDGGVLPPTAGMDELYAVLDEVIEQHVEEMKRETQPGEPTGDVGQNIE